MIHNQWSLPRLLTSIKKKDTRCSLERTLLATDSALSRISSEDLGDQ